MVPEDQVVLSGWRPISEAPQDGTWILACGEPYAGGHYDAVTVHWGTFHPNALGNECWRDIVGHKQGRVTHWMPLPPSPYAKEKP